jgi:hypothetical protein
VGPVSRDLAAGLLTVELMPGADGTASVRILAAPRRSEWPERFVRTGDGCGAAPNGIL